MLDYSRLRQRVGRLGRQRQKLERYLLRPRKMLRGSLHIKYKKCGNLNCKCARGERHGPFYYLSRLVSGKMKLSVIRRKDEKWAIKEGENYRKYQQWLAEIRKINEEIFGIIKEIRDSKIKEYK